MPRPAVAQRDVAAEVSHQRPRNRKRGRAEHISSRAQWTKTRAAAASGASDGRPSTGARRAAKRRLRPTSPVFARENAAGIRILTRNRAAAAREGRDDHARLRAPHNRRNAAATPHKHFHKNTGRRARSQVAGAPLERRRTTLLRPRCGGHARHFTRRSAVPRRDGPEALRDFGLVRDHGRPLAHVRRLGSRASGDHGAQAHVHLCERLAVLVDVVLVQ